MEDNRMNAIETTYRGYKFRSRLEAKWACVFDQFGWQWEYEPIDLNGYIPDFVLLWPHGQTLCEVKPAMTRDELNLAQPKIEASGWEHEAMIVGGGARDPFAVISQRQSTSWWWADAIPDTCMNCHRPTVYHGDGDWDCRLCGEYLNNSGSSNLDVETVWARAHNETKWKRSS